MAPTLPGVRVGPLDPDATERFGQVSGRTSARQLIRTHAAMHPPHLIRALSLKLDEDRTAALLMGEVSDALDGDEELLPEGAVIEGAQVRGERDRQQIVTFTYRMPSGRTAKGFTDYDDRFSKSIERGDEAVRISELRKTGFPLTGEGSDRDYHIGAARAQAAERLAAELRSENEKLREQLQSKSEQRPTAEQQRQAEEGDGGEGPSTDASGAEEPVPGYSELKADEAKRVVKDADAETAQAILDYEREVGGRTTVISAAEHRLDELAQREGSDDGE